MFLQTVVFFYDLPIRFVDLFIYHLGMTATCVLCLT